MNSSSSCSTRDVTPSRADGLVSDPKFAFEKEEEEKQESDTCTVLCCHREIFAQKFGRATPLSGVIE